MTKKVVAAIKKYMIIYGDPNDPKAWGHIMIEAKSSKQALLLCEKSIKDFETIIVSPEDSYVGAIMKQSFLSTERVN